MLTKTTTTTILRAIASLVILSAMITQSSSSAQPQPLDSSFMLLDGHRMPQVGLGVFRTAVGQETHDAVRYAIMSSGYRMIDTAAYYGNEQDVGSAIRDCSAGGIRREEIFVATKLPNEDHGYEKTLTAFETSRQKLGVEYIDLYLIHSPYGGLLIETWDALLDLQKRGLVRSIGVSNFGIQHIAALQNHHRPLPAVNQIEMHPLIYRQRQELVQWCQERGIVIQAYGSILSGYQEWLEKEPLHSIAQSLQREPAQVLLRWALQHGFQIIPKSARPDRIDSNRQLFDFALSEEQMQQLDQWDGRLNAYWNPVDEAPVDLGATHHWTRSSASASSAATRDGGNQQQQQHQTSEL